MYLALKKLGVLGINRRVGKYILPNNPREYYPFVDNKVLTDQLFRTQGISMPENYFVISSHGDLRYIKTHLLNLKKGFVIKPAGGSQGSGIVVIDKVIERDHRTYYVKLSGQELTSDDIRYHISGILSGLYSLNGQPDNAIVQEKLSVHSTFLPYSYNGIPDIRVITYFGFPVMAMIRLPTKASDGKANLHQAAVGCGVDIFTGKVVAAVCNDRFIECHPDTSEVFTDLVIPQWSAIIELAMKVYDHCHLGYMGADIVVDPVKGPMVLEVNARPGLSIQLANKKGLMWRLKFIEQNYSQTMSYQDRVKIYHSEAFKEGFF